MLIALNVAIGVAVIWILVRSKRLLSQENDMRQVLAAVAGTRDNAELIDRRLIQLLTQSSDDSATLRENMVEKVEQVRLQLNQELKCRANACPTTSKRIKRSNQKLVVCESTIGRS